MGWREKLTRPKASLGGTADLEFDYFTVEQGARFRALVRRAFSEEGIEGTVYSDHVESDGRQYGLHNLAAACHGARDREWDQIVRKHVAAIVRATDGPSEFDELTDEEVLSRTYVRVMGRSTVPDGDAWSYARVLAGDLIELFALDCPETVALFNTEHVERFGVDALRAAGLANVMAEPIQTVERLGVEGESANLHVVLGDSVYTASKLLTMADVLRRTVGDPAPTHGALVCVPNRHQLAFHVIGDLTVVPSLQAMVGFAADGYSDGVGAVSPFVFWWRAGELAQLSFADDDGRLRVEVSAEFAAVLEAVEGPA
jgi:hypothetical protein